MRHAPLLAASLVAAALALPAIAQTPTPPAASPAATPPSPTPPSPTPPSPTTGTPLNAAPAMAAPKMAGATQPPTNPVVARVDDTEIRMSDVRAAAAGVPDEYKQLPPQVLMPMIVDQLIDRAALLKLAYAQHLDQDPGVKAAMTHAADQTLQNALISRTVGPQVAEPAVHARYDATIAGKPGEPEVHARHILVKDEAKAKDLIAQLNKGGDFVALAKANSTDPGAADGGDLGWFKKGDMLPAFATAAFALPDNAITPAPVQTQYGWHVIQTLGHRTAPAPTYEQAREQLRQTMIQDAVQAEVKQARAAVTVVKMGPDGKPQSPTDAATPPSPPASPATP